MTGTLDQFDTLCRVLRYAAEGNSKTIKGQRPGQYVFNTMAEVFPEVAEPLRGSLLDPFYQDFKITAFLDACEDKALEILS